MTNKLDRDTCTAFNRRKSAPFSVWSVGCYFHRKPSVYIADSAPAGVWIGSSAGRECLSVGCARSVILWQSSDSATRLSAICWVFPVPTLWFHYLTLRDRKLAFKDRKVPFSGGPGLRLWMNTEHSPSFTPHCQRCQCRSSWQVASSFPFDKCVWSLLSFYFE